MSALVAGEIKLHRRMVIFEATVAVLIATGLFVVLGGPGPGVGLLAAVAVLVPYFAVSSVSAPRTFEQRGRRPLKPDRCSEIRGR